MIADGRNFMRLLEILYPIRFSRDSAS